MDQRFLELYNTELRHLRESAAEFARENLKVAGRLALDKEGKEQCPDPFIERLLEGFAFMAARVQRKIEAEFPRFTQSLLETVFPQYLSPTPSMAMVKFEPDYQNAALAEGYVIPRGTALRSRMGRNDRTACEYRTAHEVTLWPVRLLEARYFTRDLGQLELPKETKAKAAIRLRLEATAGVPFREIKLDRLPFHLRGEGDLAGRLLEQIIAHGGSVLTRSVGDSAKTWRSLPPGSLRRGGLAEEEALLPRSPRSFEGYRLLREYFAFPQRFLFCDIYGTEESIAACAGSQLDVVLALDEQSTELEGQVDGSNFEFYCSPIINLFPRQADRILLSDRFAEFHVLVDRMRPLDFEIFEVERVTGYGGRTGDEQEFRPFYKAQDADTETGAFFTTNRVPRMLTEKEKRQGRQSVYSGSEVYLALVDATAAPYETDLRELGVRAWCTNRHLPLQMPVGVGERDFDMDLSGPYSSIRCLGTPTAPVPSVAEGETAWRIISHLSLNYLSLLDTDGQQGARAMLELLSLYVDAQNKVLMRQIEGLQSVRCVPDVQRVPTPGPVAFARGLRINVLFDEQPFEGTGVFLLGSVLEQFFARYVSINSFTRTVIQTKQRGEIMQWPARLGRRATI